MNPSGKAWMDPDERHVWFEHKCVDGVKRSVLPWRHWQNINGKVSPSIVCMVRGCDFHDSPLISEPPSDWNDHV